MSYTIELELDKDFPQKIQHLRSKLQHIGERSYPFDLPKFSLWLGMLPNYQLTIFNEFVDKYTNFLKEIKFIYCSLELQLSLENTWVIYISPIITDEICKLQLLINAAFRSFSADEMGVIGRNPLAFSIPLTNFLNNKQVASAFKILNEERILLVTKIAAINLLGINVEYSDQQHPNSQITSLSSFNLNGFKMKSFKATNKSSKQEY